MFWVNSPSTDTIISAENLARAERFLTATAGSNGDFYVTVPGTVGEGDVIQILFPAATDGTKQARLSVDGGTNYYDIHFNTTVALLASAVAGEYIPLAYVLATTHWKPLTPVMDTDATWTFIFHPDGRSECSAIVTKGSAHTWTADGALFRSDELTYTFPTGLFASTDPEGNIQPETSNDAPLCWGIQRALNNTSTTIALARTASNAVFFPIALYYVGEWK